MDDIIAKAKDLYSSIVTPRVKVRTMYILIHAVVALLIIGFIYVTQEIVGGYVSAIFAASFVLIGVEVGEIKGKDKAAGGFINNFDNNFKIVIDAVDDLWSLAQSVGATIIAVLAIELFKYVI